MVSRLAAGGMGEVYVGIRHGIGQFQKPLAVKLLLPHLTLNPNAVQRFLDEARLSARMSHPNVAQVFDVGFVDDRYFLAMELVRGASLSTLIAALKDKGEPASADLIAFVGRALCDGLHHAHELTGSDGERLEVVHRDVTPHNVLVSVDGGVKLTDFGVARMLDGTGETSPGVVLGKLAYMAPEQLRGAPVDRRSDVFGVGATLFQLATLQPPFGREGDLKTLRAMQTGALVDINALRPDLPESLRQIILRCLAPEPDERFATARALRDALPAADAAEVLGALVKRLCAQTVLRVDEQTIDSSQATRGTESIASAAPLGIATAELMRTGPSRATLAIAAGLLLGVGGGGLFFFSRSSPVAEPDPKPFMPSEVEGPDQPEKSPVSAPTPTPVPRPAPAPVRPAPRAAAAPGLLSVDARPWASVFVDGTKVGDTPLAALPIEPGRHLIRLVNPETGKQHEERILVKSGEKKFLKADLR